MELNITHAHFDKSEVLHSISSQIDGLLNGDLKWFWRGGEAFRVPILVNGLKDTADGPLVYTYDMPSEEEIVSHLKRPVYSAYPNKKVFEVFTSSGYHFAPCEVSATLIDGDFPLKLVLTNNGK